MGGSYHHWCHQWCWTGSGTNSCSQWLWSLGFLGVGVYRNTVNRGWKKHPDWRANNVQVIVIYCHCKHWPWSLGGPWSELDERAFRMCTWRAVRCRKRRMLWRTSEPRPPDRRKDQRKMYKDKCQGNIGTNLWQFDEKTVFASTFLFAIFWSVDLLTSGVSFGAELGLFDVCPQLCGWMEIFHQAGRGNFRRQFRQFRTSCEQSGHRKPVDILACNAGLALGTQPIDILMAHGWYWWFLHVSSRSRPNRTAIHRRRSGRPNGNVYRKYRGGCRGNVSLRFWTHGRHKSFGSLLTGEFAARIFQSSRV